AGFSCAPSVSFTSRHSSLSFFRFAVSLVRLEFCLLTLTLTPLRSHLEHCSVFGMPRRCCGGAADRSCCVSFVGSELVHQFCWSSTFGREVRSRCASSVFSHSLPPHRTFPATSRMECCSRPDSSRTSLRPRDFGRAWARHMHRR